MTTTSTTTSIDNNLTDHPKAEVEVPKAEVLPTPEVRETKVKVEAGDKPTRANMLLVDPEQLVIITDPEDPLYDERVLLPLDNHMVKNVQEFGVKEPILFTRRNNQMVVVAGRQRVRWARAANENLKKAGLAPMKVRAVAETGDEGELLGISVLENECRRDDDMLVKARKAQKLINHGYNQSQAARVFGVHATSLRIWLKLLVLSPEVQKAVDEKKITSSAALQLSELPTDKQNAALEGLLAAAEVEEKEGNPTTDEGDGEKKPARLKDRKTGKIKITAAKVAAAAKDKGAAPKAQDKAQEGIAPKRAQVRRALKYLIEKKGTYARTMGATLAWVLGDLDAKRTELEELAADTKELVREVFRASAKKVIKVATKE